MDKNTAAPAQSAEPVTGSPAFALRGLYKEAMEYFLDGNPVTPDEYIAWQAGIIEAVTKAKLPDPKYYGGSAEEGDQHEVKCAYVDGWNECRASILAAPQPAQPVEAGEASSVDLPPRVIDQLFQAAGVSTYHPDGDQQEKLHAFARNVVAETLARLPAAPSAVVLGDERAPSLPPLPDPVRTFADHSDRAYSRQQMIDYARAASPQPVEQTRALTELQSEIDRLNAIINTPHADDFLRAVSIEAEHQRQRWGSNSDAGKTPADWFWLVGYLAGKALHTHASGNAVKAEHHVITTAAALANWHRAMFGQTDMRPGIDGDAAMTAAQPAIGDKS